MFGRRVSGLRLGFTAFKFRVYGLDCLAFWGGEVHGNDFCRGRGGGLGVLFGFMGGGRCSGQY